MAQYPIYLEKQLEVDDSEVRSHVEKLINKQIKLIPFSPIENIQSAGKHIDTDCCNVHYMTMRAQIQYRQFNSFERPYKGEDVPRNPIRGSTDELWDFGGGETGNFEYVIPASFHLVACSHCGGKGTVTCPECHGSGKVNETEWRNIEGMCSSCHGTGRKNWSNSSDYTPCPDCNGRGKRFESKSFTVQVTCPKCNGKTEVTCSSCNGSGRMLRGLKLQQFQKEIFRIANSIPGDLIGNVPMLGTCDGIEDTDVDLTEIFTTDESKKDKDAKQRPEDDSVLGTTTQLVEFDLTKLDDIEEDLTRVFAGDNAGKLLNKVLKVYCSTNTAQTRCSKFFCRLHEKNYFRYIFTPDNVEGVKNKDQELIIYTSLQDRDIYAEEALKEFAAQDMEKAEELLKAGKIEDSMKSALVGFFKSRKNDELREFINKKIIGFKGIMCTLLTLAAFGGAWYYWIYLPQYRSLGYIWNFLMMRTHLCDLIAGLVSALLFSRLLCFNLSWKLKNKIFNLSVRNLFFAVLAGGAGMLICKFCEWMVTYMPPRYKYTLLNISFSSVQLLILVLIIYLIIAGRISRTTRTILQLKLPTIDKSNGAAKVKAIERKVLGFAGDLKLKDFIILVDIPVIITIAIASVCLWLM